MDDLAARGDRVGLQSLLDDLTGTEVARAMSHLSATEQNRILTTLNAIDAAEVLDEVPDAQAAELVERLSVAQAAAIVSELPSDEQADILAAIETNRAELILSEMEPEQAADLRNLSSYAPDVAGGLMVTEVLRFKQTNTIAEVIAHLQEGGDKYVDYEIQYSYVVSDTGVLVGVLRLRSLLLALPESPISSVMLSEPLFVRDQDSVDDLLDFFDEHEFLGVPVVDAERRLLGVVKRHDVDAALTDRADGEYLKSQGIVGGEELRTMPILKRCRRRLAWLTVNIGLNILAASIIALYQDTLTAVIALAVFLPIISDMSGCSGNQAVAVSIRELSLGLIEPNEALRVWGKEVTVGAINGTVLGLFVAVAAWLWQGNVYLGLVVGSALALNTVISVSIGGAVPLLLKRWNVDPALASGPVLTTVTDMCGFLLVLGFATLMLTKLTA